MFARPEMVIRLRAGLVADAYGMVDGQPVATQRDWANTSSLTFNAAIADSGSAEPLPDGRAPVDTDFTVYCPAGTDILPADRVIVRGLLCDVQGRPFEWRSPFTGWEPGVVVHVSIREG